MNIQKPFSERLAKLRKDMTRAGCSALLISKPENRRYLSGFTAHDTQLDESSGRLLVTKKNQYLLTDFRYEIQASREAKGFTIIIYKAGFAADLARLIKKHRTRVLGFEEIHTTVAAHRELAESLTGVKLLPLTGLVENLRRIKDDSEVRRIVRALRITEEALARTVSFLKPGMTEIKAARYLEDTMVELGAEGPAFSSIVASGPNAALPHAVPGNRRIKEAETIVFDCGAQYNGYGADMTRTIILGTPRPWIKKMYQTVRAAQLAALRSIKPGLTSLEADALARDVIEEAGYGDYFGHALGHGVGLATHEAPSLSRLRDDVLEAGMIVTVEPGIYIEGRGGVRLEEMILLRQNGNRLLNRDKSFYDFNAVTK